MAGPGKRGRKRAHEVTEESKRFVRANLGFGMTHKEVAVCLGITTPILNREYPDECKHAHLLVRSRINTVLLEKAEEGNLPAIRMVQERMPMVVADYEAQAEEIEVDEIDTSKMGKKELARHVSETIHEGTEWEELLDVSPIAAE